MRLHRFIGDFDFDRKDIFIRDSGMINQILNVLRLKIDDSIILCNGNGQEVTSKINSVTKKELSLSLGEKRYLPTTKNFVHLFFAIIKKDKSEWVVEKTTECGISAITPITTARVVKQNLNTERLRLIAKEASEQCGRGTIPEIKNTVGIKEALHYAKNNFDQIFIFDKSGISTKEVIFEKNIGLFIGPEGGFTEEELILAKSEGAKILNLGEPTLRAETASIIATFIAQM